VLDSRAEKRPNVEKSVAVRNGMVFAANGNFTVPAPCRGGHRPAMARRPGLQLTDRQKARR